MRRALPVVAALCASIAGPPAAAAAPERAVHVLTFGYRSHVGTRRTAYLVVPAWYGPRRHPPIPLVISPHGRGVDGAYNLRFWGDLPARGPFALVSPDGQGRRLPLYSWGYAGQIDDLVRMPRLAHDAYPWLTVRPSRIYAVGASMGAQEALLLVGRPGIRLAGVAALDPVTNMAARYAMWSRTPGEHHLPALARVEFGSTPAQDPGAYAARSPISFLGRIARSGVPLELWWSRRDAVVTDEAAETGRFYARLRRLAPTAPVQEVVGYWEHAHEMHPDTQLPAVLACLDLLPAAGIRVPAYRQPEGGTGPVHELPPTPTRPRVPFRRTFCGPLAR